MSNTPATKPYPWAELYDLESRVSGTAQARSGKTGRPHRAYIRRKTSVMLSDEEQASLERITYLIRQALRPGSVTKSQVYGLAVRLLDHRMGLMPEHVENWEELIAALFEGEEVVKKR
jgi:hypothetical protein